MSLDGARGDRDISVRHPDGQHERRTASKPGDSIEPQDPPETRSRQEYYDALVSAHSAELDSFRPSTTAQPTVDKVKWQKPLNEGVVDRVGRGIIDERAKRFSPAERRIAEHLAITGSAVVSVSEGYGAHGRTPDARVDEVPVEFKSLDPGASDRTLKAALNSAKGQARHTVIDARGSGLTEDEAQRGIRRFSGTPHGDRLDAILVIGTTTTSTGSETSSHVTANLHIRRRVAPER